MSENAKIIINTTNEPIVSIDKDEPIVPIVTPVVEPIIEPVIVPEPVIEPTVESIDIDGVVYTMDKNGNAVDTNNAIKYTKDQIAAFEDIPDSLTIAEISKLTNIVPVDESGNKIEYEDTPQGVAKYTSDVYEIGVNQGVDSFKTNLFKAYPILLDVIKHLDQNNNSLENFTKTVEYSAIELDAKNESQLKSIILEGRLRRGDTPEKAENYYNFVKASNSEYDEATDELNFLVNNEKLAKDEAIKQEQVRVAKDAELAQTYWGVAVNNKGELIDLNKPDSIYNTIKTGKLKIGEDSYVIPDKIRINDNGKITYKTKDDFFNYLYVPSERLIDNKKVMLTGHDYDLMIENNNRGVSNDVFDAYKRFVKYDVGQFIKDNISKKEVEKITRKLTSGNNNKGNERTPSTPMRILIPKHG